MSSRIGRRLFEVAKSLKPDGREQVAIRCLDCGERTWLKREDVTMGKALCTYCASPNRALEIDADGQPRTREML